MIMNFKNLNKDVDDIQRTSSQVSHASGIVVWTDVEHYISGHVLAWKWVILNVLLL